jgi:hypothetical protein
MASFAKKNSRCSRGGFPFCKPPDHPAANSLNHFSKSRDVAAVGSAGVFWRVTEDNRGTAFDVCCSRRPPVGIVDLEYRLHRLRSQMVNSLRDPSIHAVWSHAQEPDFNERIEHLKTSGPIDAPEPLRLFKGQLEAGHFQDLGADMFDQCPMWHDDTWRRRIRREWNSTRFAIRTLSAASHQGRRHLRNHVTNKAHRRGAISCSVTVTCRAAFDASSATAPSFGVDVLLAISSLHSFRIKRRVHAGQVSCSIRTERKFPAPGRYSPIDKIDG